MLQELSKKCRIILTAVVLVVASNTTYADCEPNIPADINKDCRVDFNDFAMLSADWLTDSNEQAETKWVAGYEGKYSESFHEYDQPAIAIDSNDNVYVAGYSDISETDSNLVTIKYASDSNQPLWVAIYRHCQNDLWREAAIAIDSNDNIYVAGSTDDSLVTDQMGRCVHDYPVHSKYHFLSVPRAFSNGIGYAWTSLTIPSPLRQPGVVFRVDFCEVSVGQRNSAITAEFIAIVW